MIEKVFNPKILNFNNCFDLKARELCKSCKRYGKKATCPPYIESVEYYKKLLPTFNKGILIVEKFEITNPADWKELGKNSSLLILNKLKAIRQQLLNKGHFAVIFSAGSCKYCSDKCTFPCKHPEESAIPLEGTGIDVVYLVSKITKIELKFPVKKFFYRVGMVLYDK